MPLSVQPVGVDHTEEVLKNYGPISSSDETQYPKSAPKGKTLTEIYASDSFANQPAQTATWNLAKRFINFFRSLTKTESNETVESGNKPEVASIEFPPVLDQPEITDHNLQGLKLPPKGDLYTDTCDARVFDTIANLPSHTMYKIVLLILQVAEKLNQEGALLNLEATEKMQKQQILQQKLLREIRMFIQRDKQIAGYFKTAQDIAVAAGTIATLATMFVGVALPLTTLTSAIAAAIAAGGKSFFNVRSDENTAKFTGISHETSVRRRNIENSSERVEEALKAKIFELCSQILKELAGLMKMINPS